MTLRNTVAAPLRFTNAPPIAIGPRQRQLGLAGANDPQGAQYPA
ncbi:MAG TPA: hypothetical protein VI113_09415 [Alphaproteobacteria bacterium]